MKGADTIGYVSSLSNVLVFRAGGADTTPEQMDHLLVNVNDAETAPSVQGDSLMGFHARQGHLVYNTIELMAKNSDSGIKITDRTHGKCAQGKQTRARQPKKGSCEHPPIHPSVLWSAVN
ncbi:hypothetical protein PF008_g15604 [Phytophthora fragariae]|uniref:Uncharacterized protein n=1 Tax=Phytophthora fragariae TaxID=53985 RepID=A0A6G0REY3_9STRA|nr:hypothetical protein PF003_g15102 [Phytophthora fragariae]KAE9331015.1 hypothetical protein PF008_g15604 [Phytophthora fragariae]